MYKAADKVYFPLWTNRCCSHARVGEDLKSAIHRRLQEEMGFDCNLKDMGSFIYNVKLSNDLIENFQTKNPTRELLGKPNKDIFQKPSSSNPFSNTLITDYDYNPNKKPAPPSFNSQINDDILNQAKQNVIECNPGQPDIADKLFRDLGEQLVFEQSMRPFYSTASTTIPNDQTSFAEFCYGSMISCKEGNQFACARNLSRHTNV